MLIVSRRDAESIEIRPGDDIDPKMTLADLFRGGPIEITIFSSIALGGISLSDDANACSQAVRRPSQRH